MKQRDECPWICDRRSPMSDNLHEEVRSVMDY